MRKWRTLFMLLTIIFIFSIHGLLVDFLGYIFVRKRLTEDKKPNVVLVVADDYGWNDIGYHGSEIRTPTLDKLAAQGVKLENYYVQPMCSPSRSQLLSGRYQIHTGLQHKVISMAQPDGLPVEFPTIADKLKEAGYSTHMVGKWHIGFYTRYHLPTYRGFDSFYGHLGGGGGYYNHTSCNGDLCGYDMWENGKPINNTEGTYSTIRFASRAVKIINEHNQRKVAWYHSNIHVLIEFLAVKSRDHIPSERNRAMILEKTRSRSGSVGPLFLYLPFRSVHHPLEVPEQYMRAYKKIKNEKRRKYAGMVTCMDEAVENVTRALKKQGLWDNTVFIFTTDNGAMTSQGGNNWPLRGGKAQLWEGGIRAVGFITSPLLNRGVGGTLSRALIHVSDWYPTIVNLAGGNLIGQQPLDGVDQWETINGGPSSRTEILHNIDPMRNPAGKPRKNSEFNTTLTAALRSGDWKILTGAPGSGKWVPSPTNSSLKTIEPKETDQNVWLYNITADPTEKHNVAKSHPNVVKELLKRLKFYENTAVPCSYSKKESEADPKLRGGYWGPWR